MRSCVYGRWCHSHNIFFSFQTYECAQLAWVLYYTQVERLVGDKHYSLMGSFTSYKENFPLSNMTPGVKATSLHFLCDLQMGPGSSSVRLHLPGKACHGQPLQLILSYKENKVLWIWPLVSKSQHFIFFAAYEWAQRVKVLDYTHLERLAMDKHYSLLDSFSSYK